MGLYHLIKLLFENLGLSFKEAGFIKCKTINVYRDRLSLE
jgi:hypothetical protein